MKIIGNTAGTSAERSDLAQSDPKRAGFVKNKPGNTLPSVTSTDNDKILMVVGGVWSAVEVPTAEGEEY